MRTGGAGAPRGLNKVMNLIFWIPAHVIMQRRQLAQLRRRAEASRRGGASGAVTVPVV